MEGPSGYRPWLATPVEIFKTSEGRGGSIGEVTPLPNSLGEGVLGRTLKQGLRALEYILRDRYRDLTSVRKTSSANRFLPVRERVFQQ